MSDEKTVRAKFRCEKKEGEQVFFQAVAGDGGNESWSKWTPSGELRMSITNPPALAAFEPGKSYFLDFTPAE